MDITTLKLNDQVTMPAPIEGTNPATGRVKMAKGKVGVVITEPTDRGGFYGPTVIVRWPNGVETYHSRDLPNTLELAKKKYSKAALDAMSHRAVLAIYRDLGLGTGQTLVKRGSGQPHKPQALRKPDVVAAIVAHQKANSNG